MRTNEILKEIFTALAEEAVDEIGVVLRGYNSKKTIIIKRNMSSTQYTDIYDLCYGSAQNDIDIYDLTYDAYEITDYGIQVKSVSNLVADKAFIKRGEYRYGQYLVVYNDDYYPTAVEVEFGSTGFAFVGLIDTDSNEVLKKLKTGITFGNNKIDTKHISVYYIPPYHEWNMSVCEQYPIDDPGCGLVYNRIRIKDKATGVEYTQ